MQLKTSYFNRTLFLKTIKRFWPIWASYLAIWGFILIAEINNYSFTSFYDSDYNLKAHLNYSIMKTGLDWGLFICIAYAALSAMTVWSFMYTARSASGTASLPLRRECVFISSALAGIVPFLVSNLVVFLVALLYESSVGLLSCGPLLIWLGCVSLLFIFFYGFACLCAQLTGNIVVMPLVYLVLNFTAIAVYGLATAIFGSIVYGFDVPSIISNNIAEIFSPAFRIFDRVSIRFIYEPNVDAGASGVIGAAFNGWPTLIAYAVAGFVITVLAFILYKKRRMETAGDTVAINVLKPIFKYCMTFGCAMVFAVLLISFINIGSAAGTGMALFITAFMAVGGLIGYFSSEMLIHRSFKVFNAKGWAHFGVSAIIIVAVMMATEFDLLGIEKHVPDVPEVESLVIYCRGNDIELKNPDSIAQATELHKATVENKEKYESAYNLGNYNSGNYSNVYYKITYNLKNGKNLTRSYHLVYGNENDDLNSYGDIIALENLMNCREACENSSERDIDWNTAFIDYTNIYVITPDDYEITSENLSYQRNYSESDTNGNMVNLLESYFSFTGNEIRELVCQCILPDMRDGALGTVSILNSSTNNGDDSYTVGITINARSSSASLDPYDDSQYYSWDYIQVTPNVRSVRTNNWLSAHGIPLITGAEIYPDEPASH